MAAINREKEVAIAASDIKEWISYNQKTGEFRWIKSRGNKKAGNIAGHLNSIGYIELQFNEFRLLAHRLAWFYCYGKFPDFTIDHLDNDKTNNRIANLRDVTHAENAKNTKHSAHWLHGYVPQSKNKCKSRNVEKVGKRYRVHFVDNYLKYIFGYYDTLEEAISIRDELAENGWSVEWFNTKYPNVLTISDSLLRCVKKRKSACTTQ